MKARKEQNRKLVVKVMAASAIKTIATANIHALQAVATKGKSAINKMFRDGANLAVEGIPSGMGAHTPAWKEQTRRVSEYSALVFKAGVSGMAQEKQVGDYIFKILKASKYLRPTRELPKGEKLEKARAADATRKAKTRAVSRAKADIKKAEPRRKFKEGELEELAAAQVADKVAESKEAIKQGNAVSALLEGRASFNVLTFPKKIKEGAYSDGAMPKTQAAFTAFLATFKEESKE